MTATSMRTAKNAIDLDWQKKQHDYDVKMKRFVKDFSWYFELREME